MIRVIIGTVAVLAGFAVVERSFEVNSGPGGSCPPLPTHAAPHRGETASLRVESIADDASPEDDRPVADKRPVLSAPPCPDPVDATKSRSSGR
ncbi:MAG: hypothetical protein AAB398_08840 [Pseudomonadota bacterium]